jgi:hypothetical protein
VSADATDDNDQILRLLQETFDQLDAEETARRVLDGSRPPAVEHARAEVKSYIDALEVERIRLLGEVDRLRADVEEIRDQADAPWYDAEVDADVATFGEEAEDAIDWGLLVDQRRRLRQLEEVHAEVVSLRQAQLTSDAASMGDALRRLWSVVREIETNE